MYVFSIPYPDILTGICYQTFLQYDGHQEEWFFFVLTENFWSVCISKPCPERYERRLGLLAPSGALVYVYHGLLHTQRKPTFSKFSNSSDSKVLKRPNMCYIFEKHGIQVNQIWHSRVSMWNTQIHKYKVLKRPNMCYIF